MKNLLVFIGVIGMVFFTSCEDDDNYSLDNFWLSSGTITKEVGAFYVTTDEGKKLWPSASNVSGSLLEDGMRVLVNYTILGDGRSTDSYDYYIKINDVSQILTKPVFNFTAETPVDIVDSIGNDAVTILDTWFTDDYLNVEFEYGGGAKVHFINLVYNSENATNENGEIILELKHNKNNDAYNYRQWGIASFDVSNFKVDDKNEVKFLVKSLGKDGEFGYNKVKTYTYGMEAQSISLSNQKLPNDVSSIKLIK